MSKSLTPEQCRMARAALKWSTNQLAEEADIGLNTVNRFEKGTVPKDKIIEKIRITLENKGVAFTEDGCVCPPKETQNAS